MTALTPDAIAARVTAAFPAVAARASDNGRPFLLVPPGELHAVLRFLRDERDLAFGSVMDLTGYDLLKYPASPAHPASDAIAVVYLLFSLPHRHEVTVKAYAPRADCRLPTASDLWPATLYFEREVWDLLGVRFEGHPSLKRIMTPEDWTGHPLRKDYVYPADYHGVAHLREGQHFETNPPREGVVPPPAAKTGGHA